jgi:hypothetical protein
VSGPTLARPVLVALTSDALRIDDAPSIGLLGTMFAIGQYRTHGATCDGCGAHPAEPSIATDDVLVSLIFHYARRA